MHLVLLRAGAIGLLAATVALIVASGGPTRTVPGTGMVLVAIPPGTFTMGSLADEPGRKADEGPRTQVIVSRAFWLGRCEVTQRQWEAVMGPLLVEADRSRNAGDTLPMHFVSWSGAVNYCRKLTEQERVAGRLRAGYVFRLPTEAEWEYACRAGTLAATPEGRMQIQQDEHAAVLTTIAWYRATASGSFPEQRASRASRNHGGGETGPRPVGTKRPNAWGLCDMLGNVSEWCADWYVDALPGGSARDPAGAMSGTKRVTRGGNWCDVAADCRSARRRATDPGFGYWDVGFRVALAPELSLPERPARKAE